MLDGAFVNNDPEIIKMVPIFLVSLFILRGLASFASGASLHWVANKVISWYVDVDTLEVMLSSYNFV